MCGLAVQAAFRSEYQAGTIQCRLEAGEFQHQLGTGSKCRLQEDDQPGAEAAGGAAATKVADIPSELLFHEVCKVFQACLDRFDLSGTCTLLRGEYPCGSRSTEQPSGATSTSQGAPESWASDPAMSRPSSPSPSQ